MTPRPSPRVSVLTPCWNAMPYLEETYASLRAQTMPDWEWLVSDDGSTDGSLEYLRRLSTQDGRVHAISEGRTGLPAVGRNRALAHASAAPFVAFLDADDVWAPEKLERQLALLEADPAVGITYSHAEEFWTPDAPAPGVPVPNVWPRVEVPRRAFDFLLVRGNVPCTSSLLVRRAVIDQVGPCDETKDLRAYEDYEYILRLTAVAELRRTDGVLVRYRLHPRNASSRGSIRQTEALADCLRRRGLLGGPTARKFLSNLHLKRAEHALEGHAPEYHPRGEILRAWWLDPLNARRAVLLPLTLLPRGAMLPAYAWMKRLQARLLPGSTPAHRLTMQRPKAPS